ncbi:site-specific recombinase XerD [Mycobacteroides abscessus]|uniref:tyrosine-type recombinase/integrase n=1 Tax=Mycobacteroides abscessus TaxID=36809 RepID=UPI0005DCD1F8|nr:site-specific integrase [Mycobacteroides abscessus]CPU35540.1 site-specific recombinase XerD [Mycobacteroides abscessus]CPX57536.1 site-specific recombinase XerD [Mycobacteroides abscessus]CPZ36201.1 site-specific recombinase XerD [Mycobacteroides abscessus]
MAQDRRSFGRIRKCQPSGRYQAAYTGPDGRVYKAPETFAAKIDAEGWLTDRRREIDRELWSPPATAEQKKAKRQADTKFGDYAQKWVETRTVKGRPLRPRTRAHYETLLADHIYPTFKNKAVRDISMESVDRWYAKVAPSAPTTRAHAYGLLRTILETARKRDRLIEVNPCEIVGGGSIERKSKTRPATFAEIDTIVSEMPEHLAVMVVLATWCALRFGELVELQRGDIEIAERVERDDDGNGAEVREGVVHVRRGAVRVDGGWEVGPTKTEAGIRDVTIPPHVLPAIEAHLASKYVGSGKGSLLFPPAAGEADADGKPLRLQPSTFYRHYYKARETAKRTDLRFHDLRHTGATLYAQTGATLAELMDRIGHSTPQAAMRYQHAAQARHTKLAAAMSELVQQ